MRSSVRMRISHDIDRNVYLLAYTSIATQPFDEQQVEELANYSAAKNEMRRITGFLNYNPTKHQFLQVLEGGEDDVENLIEVISADSRHKLLNVLRVGNHPRRLFSGWAMRLIDEETSDKINLEDLLDACLRNMSDPPYDRVWLRESALRMIQQVALLRSRGAR